MPSRRTWCAGQRTLALAIALALSLTLALVSPSSGVQGASYRVLLVEVARYLLPHHPYRCPLPLTLTLTLTLTLALTLTRSHAA